MIPFENHEQHRSQHDQKTGGKDYDPRIEAPSSFYRREKPFARIGKDVLQHRKSDASQDGQHSDDDLEHVGIAAEIIEQIPLEERKTCIVEGCDGMENRVVGFLVNIQERCRIAPVEKDENGADGFDGQGSDENVLEQKDAFLEIARIE